MDFTRRNAIGSLLAGGMASTQVPEEIVQDQKFSAQELAAAASLIGIAVQHVSITTWKPDNCKCTFELAYDKRAPQEERQHTVFKAARCKYHKSGTKEESYAASLAENQSLMRARVVAADLILADLFSDWALELTPNQEIIVGYLFGGTIRECVYQRILNTVTGTYDEKRQMTLVLPSEIKHYLAVVKDAIPHATLV